MLWNRGWQKTEDQWHDERWGMMEAAGRQCRMLGAGQYISQRHFRDVGEIRLG